MFAGLRCVVMVGVDTRPVGFFAYPGKPNEILPETCESLALSAGCDRLEVIAANGSGMYTLQAIWSMAREALDVTAVIPANRSYATLAGELEWDG